MHAVNFDTHVYYYHHFESSDQRCVVVNQHGMPLSLQPNVNINSRLMRLSTARGLYIFEVLISGSPKRLRLFFIHSKVPDS